MTAPLGSLRPEVMLAGGRLIDELTGHAHALTSAGRQVAAALRAPEPVREVARLHEAGGLAAGVVEQELRNLVLLGLVEGACDSIRARLVQVRGHDPAPTFLPGTRLGCRHSGACCRGYLFGPVGERDKTRIEALDPRAALPLLPAGPLFVRMPSAADSPAYRLATVGDACVFLDESSRCGLHTAFGADAKPAFCRMFPLAALTTIDGLKIYDRGECASFAPAALTGTPIEALVSQLPLPTRADLVLHHPVVTLHGRSRCDYGVVLALARRFDEEALTQPPLAALHDIGLLARAFVVALSRCPLERGQPEATIAATLAQPRAGFRPPASQLARRAQAGLLVLAALAEGLAARVSPNEPLSPLVVTAATGLAELARDLHAGRPAGERLRAILAVSLEPDAQRALTHSLRQQLFGGELLLDDQLPAGLLRMAFVVTLTLAAARARAVELGRASASVAELSIAHMIVKRTLHRPEPRRLLAANGEQAWPVLDALSPLAGPLGPAVA